MTGQRLADLTSPQLLDLLTRLRMIDAEFPAAGETFPLFAATRTEVGRVLRERGVSDDEVTLILEHDGHQVWTDDDTEAGGGWNAYCDCGWSAGRLPSVGAADQACQEHVVNTGGRWDPAMMTA
ncbi:MAG: hypothetical protein EA387_04170 [Nitriliruptor sp.]|nr:MAG: hypothetical protein EA387_04170 [Nitriliruptor sp.]